MGCVGTKTTKPYDYPSENECMICFESNNVCIRNSRQITSKCCSKTFCISCWTQAVEVKKLTDPENALCPNCREPYHNLARQKRRKDELANLIENILLTDSNPILV